MKGLIFLLLLTTTANAGLLHKLVYVAQAANVVASLGVDGYSSERAIGVPGLRETNSMFVDGSGRFLQCRFWTIKSVIAVVPIVVTYIQHKRSHYDSPTTDLVSIASSGATAAWYARAGIHNLSLVDRAGAK
jgi:hypothetical protein